MSDFGSFNFGQMNFPNLTGGSFETSSFTNSMPNFSEFDINDPQFKQFLTTDPTSGLNLWGDWGWVGGLMEQAMSIVRQITATGGSMPSFGGSQFLASSPNDDGGSDFDFGSGTGFNFGGHSPQIHTAVPNANPGNYNEPVSGDLQTWVDQAAAVLEQRGIHMTDQDKKNMAIIAMHESGGNPNAINLSDGNAAAGHPSIGLVQTIQPTFDAYHLPGHDDIRNPVDNLIAGYLYAKATYGSTDNVPGIRALNNGGQYVGY